HAALNFVPEGFPGAGRVKLVSWSGGQWYDAGLAPDGSGTYDLTGLTQVVGSTLAGGPEGFAYVPRGSADFTRDSIVVSDWSVDQIATYELDADGNPIPATRRLLLSNISGAEGAFIDPLTGDFLFSTFARVGTDKVVVVRGFEPPKPVEPGLENWVIYLDQNGNGRRDAGERFTLTDAQGHYRFDNLVPGTYRVAEEPQLDWTQTVPGSSQAHVVTIEAGQAATGLDFGNQFTPKAVNRSPQFTTTPPTAATVGQSYRYFAS